MNKPTYLGQRTKPSAFREEKMLSHNRKFVGAIGSPIIQSQHNPNYKKRKTNTTNITNTKVIGRQPVSQSKKKMKDKLLHR